MAMDLAAHASSSTQHVPADQFKGFAEMVNRRLALLESEPTPSGPNEAAGGGAYVTNLVTNCVHWTLASSSWHHGLQKSACGWPYFNCRFERSSEFPRGTKWAQVCSLCMPERRLKMKADAQAPLSDID